MEHMLYGLMLRSGNDAAVAVAEHVAGSVPAFADMMNAKAEALGANAHFVNPHGLDAEGHGISALGLALVMREAMKNETFRKITETRRKIIPWVGNAYSRVLENKNRLLRTYSGATGGKTGYTGKAGRCLVFSAERDSLSLIGAVLNCPTWFDTATALLDYGFENYRAESALEDGQPIEAVTVKGGVSAVVNAVAGAPLRTAVPIGVPFRIVHDLPGTIEAPVRSGQVLGTARLMVGERVLAECKLIAAADVQKRDLRTSIIRLLRGWILRLQA
jgi:D-alanyl-D-alanine carboxypeptidase (penicillin-binding protein 5/6)